MSKPIPYVVERVTLGGPPQVLEVAHFASREEARVAARDWCLTQEGCTYLLPRHLYEPAAEARRKLAEAAAR